MTIVSFEAKSFVGHAICTILNPAVFNLDDEDGVAHVNADAASAASQSAMKDIALACPAGAITVENT
jgi:ferredoxin